MLEMMRAKLLVPECHYFIRCFNAAGVKKWEEDFHNLVTNEGRTNLLDWVFRTGTPLTPMVWYMGFKGALGGQAAGDTLASHAGWTEVNPQGSNRVTLTFTPAASQSITTGQFNVSITLQGPTNVGGAFVCTSQTGTSGKLYSVGDFSQLRNVSAGDTLQVSETFNA